MFKRFTVLAVALAFFAPVAEAKKAEPDVRFVAEYGQTLPPIGFVRFCAEDPSRCNGKAVAFQPSRMELTSEKWITLQNVNETVNGRIKPVSDQELYGQPEYWTYPVNAAGDCEDYLLEKKRELEAKGFSATDLLITVVLDEKGEGHAVLTVATADGDFILDNRRNEILRWTDTNYAFLKRQTRKDPKAWVSLRKDKTATKVVSASKP